MKIDYRIKYPADIEESDIIGKPPVFSQPRKELSALNIFKEHENMLIVLEGRLQAHNIRMCYIQQDLFF